MKFQLREIIRTPRTTFGGHSALARHDPDTGTVTLVLDTTTASIAMFALAAHADEREAHIREVEQYGADLPEGSYGRRNRQAIAARETRVATRLRAVQHAYQTVVGMTPRSRHHPSPAECSVLRDLQPTRRLRSNRAPHPVRYRENRPQSGRWTIRHYPGLWQ